MGSDEKGPTVEMVLFSLFRLNLNPPNEYPQSVTLATQSSKAKRKWKEGRYVCLSVCLFEHWKGSDWRIAPKCRQGASRHRTGSGFLVGTKPTCCEASRILAKSDFRIKKGSWDWEDRAARWSDMALALCPLLSWVTSHWTQG